MERFSIWVSLGIALVLVVVIVQLHPAKQTGTVRDMNALMVIAPYKYHGAWVFDDPATGLSREPFIAGIDTMIDRAVTKIPDAEQGFAQFSAHRNFPGLISGWNGGGPNPGGIGITATNSRWKAGSVPRC